MHLSQNRLDTSNGKAICYARYSSAEQGKGDSERRQGEAAQAYCRQHGLTLVETILDEGLSGYTGENRTKGKLMGFLERIRRGLVPRGTTLIIESFDRLSRQDALKQLSLFIELMKHGIHLVTLDSGMAFTRENSANPAQLFLSLASMVRGHEESKVKSDRVAAAWQQKRKNATLKPLTAKCPHWIKLDRVNGKLVLIPERAKVIRLIFKLAAEGLGKRSIAKELNGRRIKTFGAQSWQDSYIQRILSNPAVLGILQSYRQRHGEKREFAGDPVAGYYPAAITQVQWDEAHQKPSLPTGPRAVRVTNLFTGVLVDEKSKSSFQVEIRGSGTQKQEVFLRPRAAVLGLPGEDYRLSYPWFEEIFLRFLAELDWVELSRERIEDAVAGEPEEKQLAAQITHTDTEPYVAPDEVPQPSVAAPTLKSGITVDGRFLARLSPDAITELQHVSEDEDITLTDAVNLVLRRHKYYPRDWREMHEQVNYNLLQLELVQELVETCQRHEELIIRLLESGTVEELIKELRNLEREGKIVATPKGYQPTPAAEPKPEAVQQSTTVSSSIRSSRS